MKLSYIISKYKDSLQGGKGDNTNIDTLDKKQLAIGILVELEHTNNVIKALEIAIDHVTERKDYYSVLIKSGLADEAPALELYKRLYRISLKEDLLYSTNKGFEVYKNPKSIQRFTSECRAITTDNGDLYILDDGGYSMTHEAFAITLKKNGYINFSNWGLEVESIKKVPWQRVGNTNVFKLSTSFPELNTLSKQDHKQLDILINKAKQKNSQYKYIKQMIWESNKLK